MSKAIISFFLLFLQLQTFAQNTIGIPDIINYTRERYGAGTQNRGIVQDQNGILYFANQEGLLTFDGTYWKTYPLPNKTIVRSVAIGKDKRIYAGGQDDFGYFSPDKSGKLIFTSLKPLFSSAKYTFTDIWNIIPFGDDVFFRSQEHIFQLNDNSIIVYPAHSQWQFLGLSSNELVAQDTKNGLLHFSNNIWSPFVTNSELPDDYRITSMFPIGRDSSFITTVNTGFYILSSNKVSRFQFKGDNPFVNQRVLTAIPVTQDWIAIGTNLNGCYVINKNGEIIQNLSRTEGLQLNNIISLFVDVNHNLWIGLDNGIDFVAYNNSIKHIYPETLNEGEGYTSIVHNNELYVGTSNGVYKVKLNEKTDLGYVNGKFISIPNTKGSSWGLSEVNGQLLLGHHDGAFIISGENLVPINRDKAYWTFMPYYNVLPSSIVIAGNETGVDLLNFENGILRSTGNIPEFTEAAQFIAVDKNNLIWIAHPYRGVYKIDISNRNKAKAKLYNEKNNLPSALKNHLFKIKKRIVVTTEKGVYEYNETKDLFEKSSYFSDIFGSRNIRYLKEDSTGNIWFIEDKNLGVVEVIDGKSAETIYFPELDGKMVSGNEHIYPYNNHNVFVGAEKGFYHINFSDYKKNRYKLKINLSSVRAFGKTDSTIYGGYYFETSFGGKNSKFTKPEIAYTSNSFHFEYASPLYERQNSVMYSYYLEGLDDEWSNWSKRAEKDYTNLSPGVYTFMVKAKTNLGNVSEICNYSFTVLPPWYNTLWAWIVYSIIIASGLYGVFRWQKKVFLHQQMKHEAEQKQLQYLHQLELDKSEKEIIQLKNEKLESEIEHKNSELAATAMHLVQKGELLTNIKEEMGRLKKNLNGHASTEDFKKVFRILNVENRIDKDWEKFAAHFDNVHSGFLKALKLTYPTLTAHELKLCAYLRMNFSSKQIAQLENISVRGVELSRYRLRKRLSIPDKDISLYSFLLEIDGESSQ